jgi:hypothetical protein
LSAAELPGGYQRLKVALCIGAKTQYKTNSYQSWRRFYPKKQTKSAAGVG